MEIRGLILSAKPAILPTKILDGEVRTQEIPASVIFPQKKSKIGKKQKPKRPIQSRRKTRIGNLQPIAMKSINKIAEAIKMEEQINGSHMVDTCLSCNTEILNTTNFCPFCGHKQ